MTEFQLTGIRTQLSSENQMHNYIFGQAYVALSQVTSSLFDRDAFKASKNVAALPQ